MAASRYRLSSSLSTADVPAAAALAAAAFANSPCYSQILGSTSTLQQRRDFLTWLFEKNIKLREGDGAFRTTHDGGKMISFFMFCPPDARNPSFCDMVFAGLLTGLFYYGPAVVKRLLETKSWFENKELEVLGERAGKMIRLERMTVLPGYQGQGVGTFALSAALREADAQGRACILATQERRNVVFYSRLGFIVVDESVVPIGDSYMNWIMIREPQSSSE